MILLRALALTVLLSIGVVAATHGVVDGFNVKYCPVAGICFGLFSLIVAWRD